jgi:hypothetical protein
MKGCGNLRKDPKESLGKDGEALEVRTFCRLGIEMDGGWSPPKLSFCRVRGRFEMLR